MTNEKILVTGGTGFAGRYAIKRLIQDGYSVCAVVRSKDKLQSVLGKDFSKHENLRIIELINSEQARTEELTRLIEVNHITTIVHIAGIVGEQKKTWKEYYETNVLWSKNLATAFLQANVPHNKFIFTSSVGVYGTIPQKIKADESTIYNPDGNYHKSKVLTETELLALKSSSNLPLIILRPTIMYGAEDKGFLLKLFKVMSKKIFPLARNNPCIHLLDIECLAETYSKFVSSKTAETIYNVADKEPIKIKDLVEYIKNSMDSGYRSVPSFVFSALRKVLSINKQYTVSTKLISQDWSYNTDKLYNNFDFKPMNTLQILNEKYITWYSKAVVSS